MLYDHVQTIEDKMQRLIKWLLYLALAALTSLVVYTYVGPYFGADFSAPQTEIRVPVTLVDD
jgi:hypothetical protein